MDPKKRKGQAASGVEQLVQRLASDASKADLSLSPQQQEAMRAIAVDARAQAGATDSRTRDPRASSIGVFDLDEARRRFTSRRRR